MLTRVLATGVCAAAVAVGAASTMRAQEGGAAATLGRVADASARRTIERDVREGTAHTGRAAVVQVLARRP